MVEMREGQGQLVVTSSCFARPPMANHAAIDGVVEPEV